MEKPYYNHDHLWEQRHVQKKPVWGPHSEAAYHNILNRVLHIHPQATSLFDAGCGAGALGLLARRRGLQYTGVDESTVGIRMGKEAYPQLDLRSFDMVRGAPEDCRHNRCVVTCVNVLHCLTSDEDRRHLLLNLHHVAKPDGVLALSTMCLPIKSHFRQANSPRAFYEADHIYREFEASGWGDLILREFIPADEISPVTNVLIIARKSSQDPLAR